MKEHLRTDLGVVGDYGSWSFLLGSLPIHATSCCDDDEEDDDGDFDADSDGAAMISSYYLYPQTLQNSRL